ncbi:hypothetical protein [Spiroplasma melliferum]|uniref:Membrane protein n=2 Tax=Spiroplasma melliferum TaxID=2134 RepID=A0AAI9T2N0_SPIME|nr:hypothetical protein [Spiroplasma melliferum]ELL44162.1 putative transmembrane protein [Spiroplasma melliferum IPMB4A]KAI92292.1 membrane protein [Spiroplasma melliferum KC3]QCO23724.1 hypothetical protein SRED_002198 [Spiroplasma melliferum]
MGTLLSILGSLGIVSSNASAPLVSTTAATSTSTATIGFWDYLVGIKNILTSPNLLNEAYALYNVALGELGTLFKLLRTFEWSNLFNEISSLGMTTKNLLVLAKNIAQRINQLIPDAFLPLENLTGSALAELEWIAGGATEAAVEGGILAGSLGTAVETLGISLLIGAVIYGGYYTYTHWDDVKHFANKISDFGKSVAKSVTNYFSSWWS